MTNYITLEEIQSMCLSPDLSVQTYIEDIFLVLFRIWVRNGYWSLGNMFITGAGLFFFYSRENLFDAVNILFDWYDQIIESLWEKKQ